MEDVSLLIGVYWAVVSMATVGYGDVVPTTTAAKLFTIAYMIASVGLGACT